MARPKLPRRIRCKSSCMCYTPDVLGRGFVLIEKDEYQALKLYDVDGFDQNKSSKKMNISQPTFARILSSAHKKVSKAIIKGQEIKIN